MIKEDKIAEIRERASIVEVVSDYLTLRKVGRNYLGLCPFHAEKTPSFTVSEEKGIYHCFGGCGAGGSVFHFLMQYDHLSFPEAVERVAKRYGIALEHVDGFRKPEQASEKESLYRLNETAAGYFQKVLWKGAEGGRAQAYLKSRGVEESVARRFLVGYAPQKAGGLLDAMRRDKLPLKDAARLGLVGERGAQQYYEKFFSRLMFPILNPGGKIVGFGGRVLGDGLPKYLNSSETPLFRKGAALYGLFQAKESIRRTDRVVIVEGYLDVIALSQFGVAYAVATLGTALTPDHVRILSRYSKNIIALFDGDDAGRKAAARSFEIFIEGGLLGRAAFLPKGEDPDTFVRSRGKDALEMVIEQAVPLADYYFSWLEHRYGRSLEGKSQVAGEVSRLLSKIRNPFEVDLLVRRAVDTLGVREELLRRTSSPAPRDHGYKNRPGTAKPVAVEPQDDIAERSLVGLMVRFPSVIEALLKEQDFENLIGVKWKEVISGLVADWRERGRVDVAGLAQRVAPERAAQLTALAFQVENVPPTECEKMASDCLSRLQEKYLQQLKRDLRIEIRAAEEKQDEKAKRERILEWQDVVRRERQLERRKFVSKTGLR